MVTRNVQVEVEEKNVPGDEYMQIQLIHASCHFRIQRIKRCVMVSTEIVEHNVRLSRNLRSVYDTVLS